MYFTHTAEYDVEEKGFSERPTLYRVLHYIKNNKMMMLHHFLLSGVFFPIILVSSVGQDKPFYIPSCVAQSITCLATDASLTADPGGREFDPSLVPYFRGD